MSTTFSVECKPGSDRWEAVCAWLTANGFDPNDVPIDATVVINGDQVTVTVIQSDDSGNARYDPVWQEVQVMAATRPLTVPPSDLVLSGRSDPEES